MLLFKATKPQKLNSLPNDEYSTSNNTKALFIHSFTSFNYMTTESIHYIQVQQPLANVQHYIYNYFILKLINFQVFSKNYSFKFPYPGFCTCCSFHLNIANSQKAMIRFDAIYLDLLLINTVNGLSLWKMISILLVMNYCWNYQQCFLVYLSCHCYQLYLIMKIILDVTNQQIKASKHTFLTSLINNSYNDSIQMALQIYLDLMKAVLIINFALTLK